MNLLRHRLRSHCHCPPHRLSSSFRWPGSEPVAFFDVDGVEGKPPTSNSYANVDEASVCLRLLMIFATDPSVKSIAILTTYKAQVRAARRRERAGIDLHGAC